MKKTETPCLHFNNIRHIDLGAINTNDQRLGAVFSALGLCGEDGCNIQDIASLERYDLAASSTRMQLSGTTGFHSRTLSLHTSGTVQLDDADLLKWEYRVFRFEPDQGVRACILPFDLYQDGKEYGGNLSEYPSLEEPPVDVCALSRKVFSRLSVGKRKNSSPSPV